MHQPDTGVAVSMTNLPLQHDLSCTTLQIPSARRSPRVDPAARPHPGLVYLALRLVVFRRRSVVVNRGTSRRIPVAGDVLRTLVAVTSIASVLQS